MLEVSNLSLGFNCECGFRQALYDVSFKLEQGKMLALVGESGCGKTITSLSILKLLPKNAVVTDGQILFEGQDLLTTSNINKIRGSKIALIPQDPMTSLNPLYTVGNQLEEVIKAHNDLSDKEIEQKALEVFDAVKIPCAKDRLKSYPHEFSGGMKQRAIIAMALATNAKILIADEPTTALDVTIQAQIMNLLKELKKDISILLITHDLALVSENADDVCVMYAGRIVEKASSQEFFANPNHPYSKALLKAASDKSETIFGQPPSIQQTINGCKFHPRCENCMEICKTDVPVEFDLGNAHKSFCWLNK